jgi:Asp-tRNA(Asn)/Glu-tRNA(Gln) amidotransferase A subunit family amidase
VPIALKDLIDEAGVATTAGSSFLREIATRSAPVVERLERAGAVVIGRTGLHEFAYGFSSENDWWGPVRNPWDPGTSPGGSSGGSAAVVAAQVVPVGIGTDTGGSVRVPAAMCGLVGLKVSHGRIPLSGVFPLAPSLDTVGPITQTVGDARIAYRVMAGFDPDDAWSTDRDIDPPVTVALDGLRVAVPHPWVDRPLQEEQERGLETVIEALVAGGARVDHVTEPVLDPSGLSPAAYREVADVHREWYTEDPSRYGSAIRDRLAAVFVVDDATDAEARAWRAQIRGAFARVLSHYDVVLTPTTAGLRKEIGEDEIDVGAGPEPYRPVLSCFTPLVNQAGLPAIALPIEDPRGSGLPPSAQFIAPMWAEERLLGLAESLDRSGVIAHRSPPHRSGTPTGIQ